MALSLGKLTILIGAGMAGSALAKEGSMSSISDYVSGAFKVVFRQLRHDGSTSTKSNTLMAQVNSLREELQMLASSRPVTIITSKGSGTGRYGIIIIIGVVGYGYIWWKGWRLPDMMFATRRSLSDARDAIAKQLENVYSSVSTTRQHLSSRIDGVGNRLDEISEITAGTQDEVSQLQDKSKLLNNNVQSVRYVVQTLESKINRIEGKQDMTNEGVIWLCDYAQSVERSGLTDHIEASPSNSSRPPIEAPPIKSSSRASSLPPLLPLEQASLQDSNGSHKQSTKNIVSATGLKEVSSPPARREADSNGNPPSEETSNASSSFGLFGTVFSSASFLTRTRSATNAFK